MGLEKCDGKWLKEFRGLFPVAAERYTPKAMDLAGVYLAIEEKLSQARSGSEMRVSRDELEIIEEAPWDYHFWWPRFSNVLNTTIVLSRDLRSRDAKQKAVDDLYEHLKHIEVVSVVLRFLCPEEFGIISTPVVSLVNLVPAKNPQEYYIRYLDVLARLRTDYGDGVLQRLADIDMALWSAAHLSIESEFAALTEEMYRDENFQEIRLENLLAGLKSRLQWTDSERILLARVLLKYDYMTVALVAVGPFESLIREIEGGAREWDVRTLAEEVQKELRDLGLLSGDAKPWGVIRRKLLGGYRNKAVHPTGVYPTRDKLSKREAEGFVRAVVRLKDALEDLKK